LNRFFFSQVLRNTVPPIIPSHENIFEKVKEPGIKDSAEFKTGDEKALDVSEIDAEDPFKGFESGSLSFLFLFFFFSFFFFFFKKTK